MAHRKPSIFASDAEGKMRTTLDIDDDVLSAAKELARRQHCTAGEVLSELARQGLRAPASSSVPNSASFFGFRPFSSRGAPVSDETINRLRDEAGI
jgi:hypothetical protein